jgi:hypothetical protein
VRSYKHSFYPGILGYRGYGPLHRRTGENSAFAGVRVLSESATKPLHCRSFIRRPKLTEVSYALESVSRLRVPAGKGCKGGVLA